MKIEEVFSIKNLPGLYLFLDGHQRGVMVESIADGKRTFVSERWNIACIANGGLFVQVPSEKEPGKTKQALMPLEEVFVKMKASPLPLPADNAGGRILISYMKSIVANLDETKAYPSFLKKVIQWYSLLDGKLSFADEKTNSESTIYTGNF